MEEVENGERMPDKSRVWNIGNKREDGRNVICYLALMFLPINSY